MSLATKLQAATARQADTPPHVIVKARAGTGKTTTLVEGLKFMRGLPTKVTPSDQQRAVWDQLALSRGARTVGFVAFNKSIAEELKARVPAGVDAKTMHGLGFGAVTKAYGKLQLDEYLVQSMIAEELQVDGRQLRKDKPVLLKAVDDLVGLCKANLVDPTDEDALDRLVSHYGVELDDDDGRDFAAEVYGLVPVIMERCRDPRRQGRINFDDMVWLPVAMDLPVFRFDVLLVDEAQDLNRCQQALAKKAGRRLVLVGDDRQAIYGFAGADAESLARMERELNDGGGCTVLPLTVTRRCGKAIVEEARKTVPDFEAHPNNPPGKISTAAYASETKWYGLDAADGDMVLCRLNAPLVSQCFRFIRAGKKANIQGRDVGRGLVSVINKLHATSVADLVARLGDWLESEQAKEHAKRNPSEDRLTALSDRHNCILCFTEGLAATAPVDAVIAKVEQLFTDNKAAQGIRLSSIHKAKGLEARRVFFLRPEKAPCPLPRARAGWEREQEMNLLYVGVTRAIEELVWVI